MCIRDSHGARRRRQRWTVISSLYCTRWGITSQCRSSCISRESARSYFPVWPNVLQHFEHAATCPWPSLARKTKQLQKSTRDVTEEWINVFTDSMPSERWTRFSCRNQKKHVLQTFESCLSRPKSATIVTPRSQHNCSVLSHRHQSVGRDSRPK